MSSAADVSVREFDDQYFQVSFDSEPRSEDDFDLSIPDHPYLIVQLQFEDDDGGVCYIETHDHDACAGHFHLQLIEFISYTPLLRNREAERQVRRVRLWARHRLRASRAMQHS